MDYPASGYVQSIEYLAKITTNIQKSVIILQYTAKHKEEALSIRYSTTKTDRP